MERREVLVVGGGPAGAATAIGLARRGRDVLVVERSPAWRWRACGVFTSPATVAALRRAGLGDADFGRVARRIPAMRVETASGTRFRLTYGDDGSLTRAAVGLDRSALDPLLLERARAAGVEVREGVGVRSIRDGRARMADGIEVEARLIVGADGLRSVVARDAGVVRRPPLGDRRALTFHVADPAPEQVRDARMITFDGGYVGLAPVPGGRVNVGIVLASRRWRERLRHEGAAAVASAVMAVVPPADDDPVPWSSPRICDGLEGAAPVGSRVSARSGDGWLLVGDAAGFLDPFTGEGLHRALRSAELAGAATDRHLAGASGALAAYDGSLARRTRAKDVVSLLIQAFLEVPPLFDYAARRLADRPAVRETMGLVIGDLAPASTALDPRFLAGLLPAVTETGQVPELAPPGRTRIGGYALCMDDAGRILLARLSVLEVDVGAWTLPGGGIEFGEHPDHAVLRELEEETGYLGEIQSVAGVFSHVYPRSAAAEGRDLHFIGVLYHVRIVGGALRDERDGTTDTARWMSQEGLAGVRLVEVGRFGVDLAFARLADRAPA